MSKKCIILIIGIFLYLGYTTKSNAINFNEEIKCLASNIYHESKGESKIGMAAVGMVVMNRLHDSRWPKTVCGVIKQIGYTTQNKKTCQFSWYCQQLGINYKSEEWHMSLELAKTLYFTDKYSGLLQGANHFHSTSITKPVWTKKMIFITKIDNHMFYRLD